MRAVSHRVNACGAGLWIVGASHSEQKRRCQAA
jgi:hypothetical protein